MRALALTLFLPLALSACADDSPSGPAIEVVTPAPPHAPSTSSLDTARAAPSDAPADAPAASATPVASDTPPPAPEPAAAERRPAPTAEPAARLQTVAVTVTASGFEPSRITLDADVPARLVFTRTSDRTCATQVVFPSLGIGPVDLPLGEPVSVDVPAGGPDEIAFACGMDMLRGTLVVGS